MANPDNMSEMLELMKNGFGTNSAKMQDAAKNGNTEGLMQSLSEAQRNKVNQILSDPEQSKKLLENPQVQALIKRMMK